MRAATFVLAAGAALAATAAAADPTFEIRNAAARVIVVPEARSDIAVTILKRNPRLPLAITRNGDTVVVDGRLGWAGPNCHGTYGHAWVDGFTVGRVGWDDLPQVVVHTPLKAHVSASGAVFGSVGRGHGLEFANAGCGDWMLADQAGAVHVRLAGSGDVRAGGGQNVQAQISGSSGLTMREADAGLSAAISGSGDIRLGRVDGPLHVRVGGSGDVEVRGGQVSDMDVSVAGSGDVRFGGVARSLEASVAGSGDITAAHVTGSVTKHIAGSGDVTVGR